MHWLLMLLLLRAVDVLHPLDWRAKIVLCLCPLTEHEWVLCLVSDNPRVSYGPVVNWQF